MKIENMECFCVLAEVLNYSEAAERLFMTQSALTRLIQQMETEIGLILFDRSRRSVSLTPAGERFLEDAKKLLNDYYDSLDRASDAAKGLHGHISFGTRTSVTNAVTFDIINGFQKSYPEIGLKIESENSTNLVYNILEGKLDCGIVTMRTKDPNIEMITLKKYRECVVMSPDHPLASRERLSFEELKNEQFTVIKQSFAVHGYERILSKARELGFTPNIDMSAVSVPHLMNILALGKSVSILSDNYKMVSGDRLVFVPLEDETVVELLFMWNTNINNPCVSKLADYVRENFKRHIVSDED